MTRFEPKPKKEKTVVHNPKVVGKKIRKHKPLSKAEKKLAYNELNMIQLTKERVENAFGVCALHCGSPKKAKEQITVERVDMPDKDKINHHIIYIKEEKIWEGWYLPVMEEVISKSNLKSQLNKPELRKYSNFEERWTIPQQASLEDFIIQGTPQEEIEALVTEILKTGTAEDAAKAIGEIYIEDLNRGIID